MRQKNSTLKKRHVTLTEETELKKDIVNNHFDLVAYLKGAGNINLGLSSITK